MSATNLYVWQISFDIQLQIQQVKKKNECQSTSISPSKMSPQCHMPISTCHSISNVNSTIFAIGNMNLTTMSIENVMSISWLLTYNF